MKDEASKLRNKILSSLPMATQLETHLYYYLKSQPAAWWEELEAKYDPAPDAPERLTSSAS